jgi:hypothetical protein
LLRGVLACMAAAIVAIDTERERKRVCVREREKFIDNQIDD